MSQHQAKRTIDPMAIVLWVVFGIPAIAVMLWLAWIFVSVVFLGRSSSCPQNLC